MTSIMDLRTLGEGASEESITFEKGSFTDNLDQFGNGSITIKTGTNQLEYIDRWKGKKLIIYINDIAKFRCIVKDVSDDGKHQIKEEKLNMIGHYLLLQTAILKIQLI